MRVLILMCFVLVLCSCSQSQDKMVIDCQAIQTRYLPQYYVLPIYQIAVKSKPITMTIPKRIFPAMPEFGDANWSEILQKYYQDCAKLR